MRAFLAALSLCLVASSAHAAPHHAPAGAAMIARGLIHMMESAKSRTVAWPTAETMMGAPVIPAHPIAAAHLRAAMAATRRVTRAAKRVVVATAKVAATTVDAVVVAPVRQFANDPRPHAWCGWYLRQIKHVADRAFNLAANWAHYGQPAPGPGPGVIAVWPHHVGEIVGYAGSNKWFVHSGNDGHAVRTRARSLSGVIALRI